MSRKFVSKSHGMAKRGGAVVGKRGDESSPLNAVDTQASEQQLIAASPKAQPMKLAKGALDDAQMDAGFKARLAEAADDHKDGAAGTASSTSGDGGGISPVLLVGGIVGLGGIAGVALSGGGHKNQAPTLTVAAQTTNEDTAKTFTVTGTDPENGALTYTAGTAAHGTVAVGANGSLTYTPAANYNGADSFTVTVTDNKGLTATQTVAMTVTAVNDAPTVAATQAVTTGEDVAKQVTVVGADVDNTTLTYTASAVTHGTVTGGTGGVFTFTPEANYYGNATFDVTVSDGALTAKQTVTVAISSNINETVSIDLANGATEQTEDAAGTGYTAGDSFKYVDNSAVATDVVITHFAAGDTIEVTGDAAAYSFTAIGDDLEISFNNTQAGVNNVILLKDVGAGNGFIDDEATAELVLGRDFFHALTAPGNTGDGVAVANGNLDDDNDANVQTTAITDAAGSNVAFTEDANIANSVLVKNFAAGDTITVSNAALSAYSFTAVGDDVVISYLKGAITNEIVLQGVAKTATGVIDSVDDVEALLGAGGAGFFKAAPAPTPGTGGGVNPGTTQSIDVGSIGASVTKDAGTGSIKFVDTIAVGTDVIIQHFTNDDRIQTNATLASQSYSFSVSTDDAKDLVIEFNNTDAGVSNVIVLDNVLTGDPFVSNYAEAVSAIGYDFMIFG